MDARRDVSELAGTNAGRVAGNKRKLKIAGAILVIVGLLIATTHSPQTDSKAARPAAADLGRTDAAFVGEYFPAQFGSPRANDMPEVHIQAF